MWALVFSRYSTLMFLGQWDHRCC